MKKTLTVNLNNIVFHIDDDAFEMLQTYLADVARHLSEDEKKEVMNDIEARIAELFNERLQRNKNVVNIEDIEEIIKILGKPNQFSDADDEETETEAQKSDKKRTRRFYRDPENAILGGISAGIAAYFGWDVTWVRIALVVIAFISAGNIIPVYLLVWVIAPKAVSAAQRLEMQGEEVTVENIKTEINNVKNYVDSEKFKQSASSIGEKFIDVFRVFFKIIFGFVGAVLGFVAMILIGALIIALMYLVFQPGVYNNFSPELITNWSMLTPDKAVMLIISILLVVGCPIFMLIYWIIRLLSGRRNYSNTSSWIVLILWIAGLFMFYSVGAETITHWKNNPEHHWIKSLTVDDSPITDEVRECENFTGIEVSGNIELTLTQDATKQIVVSAPENNLSNVITKVENGVLKIYTTNTLLNTNVKVSIATDTIYNLEANGASKIITPITLTTSKLAIKLSGASQAELDINVIELLDIELSGASQIDIKGNAADSKMHISGASQLEANELMIKNIEIETSGASQAEVFASESIDADASGASQIECDGNPKRVKKSDNMGASVTVR